jgi:DNA (cytosine-5)-methyltransferase 1
MPAYYNEIDPFAAQWLRNLIRAGHIADGEVDERSIKDVKPDDLREFTQCHFFAGIGVWSYALRRAGWPDDRPVWTGSCPCQPFSAAGEGAGFTDDRHLWPTFFHLIEECRPPVVLGEQVASKAAEPWLDLVQTDLETLDYRVAAVAFPTSSVGGPHIRDRLYWVGDSSCSGLEGHSGNGSQAGRTGTARPATSAGLHDSHLPAVGKVNGFWRNADWLRCRDGLWRAVEPGTQPLADRITSRVGRLRAYGNAINAEAAKAFIESYLDTF